MKTFLIKIKLFSFFNQLIFAYPIYSIMFRENGLDMKQVGVLLSAWAFSALVLEVPLGVLADKFDRRIILSFGSIFKMLVFVIWILFPSFIGYLSGFVLWGLSGALISGTFEAYVYDELVEYNKESEYESLLGKISFLKNIGVAIALLCGGVLSEFGYELVLGLSILSCVISFVSILSAKSARKIQSTGESSMLKDLKSILPTFISNKVILSLSLIFLLLLGAYGTLDEIYPLLYNQLKIPNMYVGMLGTVGYLFAALGGLLISKEVIKTKFNILLGVLLTLLCYLGLALTNNILFIILHFPLATVLVMSETNIVAKLQENFNSSVRATSLSLLNMFKELVVIIALMIVGFVTEDNVFNAFYIGSFLVFLSLIFTVWYRRLLNDTKADGT